VGFSDLTYHCLFNRACYSTPCSQSWAATFYSYAQSISIIGFNPYSNPKCWPEYAWREFSVRGNTLSVSFYLSFLAEDEENKIEEDKI